MKEHRGDEGEQDRWRRIGGMKGKRRDEEEQEG